MFKSSRRKKFFNSKKLLWRAMRSLQLTGSMPSWALPIETIAAWMYLGGRVKKNRHSKDGLS